MLLQETVTRMAERRPDATAVIADGKRVTYGELDIFSNQLAWLLTETGCRPGDRVCILVPKSVEAITGMLGALKAGCIYVPMDTRSPAARLAKIVNVSEPRCILAANEAAGLLSSIMAEKPSSDEIAVGWLESVEPGGLSIPVRFRWPDLRLVPSTHVENSLPPGAPAHMLFTSGSTGVPKGVVITHSNVLHFIEWATKYFGITERDRNSCHPPLHFDLSTFDVYGTFLAGAELHLVPAEAVLLPQKLAGFIRDSRLTQWISVPSALRFMAQFDAVESGDFPLLRRVLWCGEALPTPTLMYWMRRLPHVQFTNLYGPTETTIASSYYTVPACPRSDDALIPIGRACDNESLFVLDENRRPLPQGEIGDLYIGGAGLSPGYWRDETKTKAAFIDDEERGRIYRTGDLAREGEDGLIYLLGRSDSQIKSRGYRIELGEIESALYTCKLVRECAIVAVPTKGFEGMAICCAYSTASGTAAQPAELRTRLSELVPPYMLPSRWLPMESLPLNANGKIDRPRVREQFLAER